MSLKEIDFPTLNLTEKKNLLENTAIMTEFDSALDPKKPITIQSIDDETSKKYTIYGWEPAVILKFKYISRNEMTPTIKKEFWERVIWNGNNKLEDTDILDNVNIKLPFRFLTKEESEEAGSSKMVRNIKASDKLSNAVNKTSAMQKLKPPGYVENDSFYDDELDEDIDVDLTLGGGKRKKRRRKKKKKKAFPSRRKNNRKNRTKKKALSK